MMALIMGLDGSISRIDGGMLFLGILLYTGLQVLLARREITQKDEPAEREGIQIPPLKRTPMGYLGDLALSLGGLVILVVGARLLVTGAVDIARSLGISELIIGLTIVAAGTSMPEVAASVMASIKGQRDIAVGNVVGSNVFNILAVLGMSALVSPNGVPVSSYALRLDIPAMVLVSALCIPVFLTGRQISRLEGWAFLGLYAAYTTTLILMAMGTIALPW
jgi:cation:H+ antiporter